MLVVLAFSACNSTEDPQPLPDVDVKEEDPPRNDPDTYLSLEKKYNGNIIQPVVRLVGDLADDFKVLDAGYWEAGNNFKTINGVISLQYVGEGTVLNTVVNVTLKDNKGNAVAYKTPEVFSASETSYLLAGGSTFLYNTSPLIFSYKEKVDLGGGASVESTVTTPNNVTYAQRLTGKDVVKLIQVLSSGNASNPDFTGEFGALAEIELEYFSRTTNINNSNAYVNQKYFENDGKELLPPEGDVSSTKPVFNAANESWEFTITNNSDDPVDKLQYRLLLQDKEGTTVAFELETSSSLMANEAKAITVDKSDLFLDLSFLNSAEIQGLAPSLLLNWE